MLFIILFAHDTNMFLMENVNSIFNTVYYELKNELINCPFYMLFSLKKKLCSNFNLYIKVTN